MTVAKPKASTTKSTTKSINPSIYIGPTIPKTGLQHGVILNNGIPKDATDHVKVCKEIEKMIIVADQVAEARLNISKVGTSENKFFEKISKYVGGIK